MSNSEGGRWLNQELITAIALEYVWPDPPVVRRLGTATMERLHGLVGVYRHDGSPGITFTVELADGKATGQVNQYPPFVLTPTTEPDLFVFPRESMEIGFQRAADGTATKVLVGRAGEPPSSYSRAGDP